MVEAGNWTVLRRTACRPTGGAERSVEERAWRRIMPLLVRRETFLFNPCRLRMRILSVEGEFAAHRVGFGDVVKIN